MDTGFTYMYYPPPSNFNNSAITGGPIYGGTSVVIEGSGFTRGYRSDNDIDLSNLIMRCRFTDKPSIVGFRACEADPTSAYPSAVPLSVIFDVPTNGVQLATDPFSGNVLTLLPQQLDELFEFSTADGAPTKLADTYSGQWLDDRTLRIYATETAVVAAAAAAAATGVPSDDDGPKSRLFGGSGLRISMRAGQSALRLKSVAGTPPYDDASAPVSTSGVGLAACFAANGTAAGSGDGGGATLEPTVSFVAPVELTPTRVVCVAPSRGSPVVSDLDIALNGQDYHSNALTYAYYVQPTSLTHLTPVTAGPTIGGSVITVHGAGLAAFQAWGAGPANARCRWNGDAVTIPSMLSESQLTCPSASMPFTAPTEVGLEIALNDRDFIAVTRATSLRYMYYVQPREIKSIFPTGGRMSGATVVTVDGGGFEAYAGVNVSDVRMGWGDTEATNLTTPLQMGDSRLVVRAYRAVEPGPRQMYLTLNNLDLYSINASFLYYEQPSNYSGMDPTGGPTRGGTSVTITGGPFDVFSSDRKLTLCRFGSLSSVVAETFERHQIVCRTPQALEPGTVQVAVSLNGADTDFGLIGYAFKYYQQPRPKGGGGSSGGVEDLQGITPIGGPKGGGTRVTILGSGFLAFAPIISYVRCRWMPTIVDAIASINAQEQGLPPPETAALEHSDARIVCPTPAARAGAAGEVNLTLSLNLPRLWRHGPDVSVLCAAARQHDHAVGRPPDGRHGRDHLGRRV